jgi:lantibiotic modifying enzyme
MSKTRITIIVTLTLLASFILAACKGKVKRVYLSEAQEAAKWILASSIQTDEGKLWPSVPGDKESINTRLYHGIPGTVLFFLELYYTTGNKDYLEAARQGTNYLLSHFEEEISCDLYVGLSGVAFAMEEMYKASNEQKYRDGFLGSLSQIKDRAKSAGRGVGWAVTDPEGEEWPSYDLLTGDAGTGLFLLYAFRELQDKKWLDLAALTGDRLIEIGIKTETGTKWASWPDQRNLMPNFSHGTAGVAYFLACLYEATKDEKFLQSALDGARYLQSIAETEGDVCLIFHDEPNNKDLFYLGWCHGPAGTARLFYKLFQVTGEKEWMEWVEKGANGILKSGIPENRTPGFWDNLGLCCGSAGVAEFFLNLYRVTAKDKYKEFALKLTDEILAKGSRDESGLFWVSAEFRIRPEFVQAQTGLMQGAAGIGLWFLHLDSLEQNTKPRIVLPDDPY